MRGHNFFSYQTYSCDLFVNGFSIRHILLIRLMFDLFENCNLFVIIPFACFFFAVPTNHKFILFNFKQLICKLITKLCLRTYFLFLVFIRFMFAEFYNIELIHWSLLLFLLLCNIMLFSPTFFCTKNENFDCFVKCNFFPSFEW